MRKRLLWLTLIAGLLCTNSPAQWVRTNGPYGGHVSCLAVNGTSLFAGTKGNGIFRSTDNGTHWTPVNAGLTEKMVNALVVIGTDLLAGTSGIPAFRSSDNGASWTRVDLEAAGTNVACFSVSGADVYAGTFGGVFHSTDGGTTWTPAGWERRDVITFARVGTSLFAGMNSTHAVYRSIDSGKTWTPAYSGLSNSLVRSLVASGTNLFAGTGDGEVFRSTDYGSNWHAADSGLTNKGISQLVLHQSRLFACTAGGLFRSTDDGSTWSPVGSLFVNSYITSFLANGELLFAGTTREGVFCSSDDGENWVPANSGLTNSTVDCFGTNGIDLFAGTSGFVLRSSNGGVDWIRPSPGLRTSHISCIVPSGTILYAGTSSGVFRSTDSGASWSSANAGLKDTVVHALAVSGMHLFASTTGSGGVSDDALSHSIDSGRSWTRVELGPTELVNCFAVIGDDIFAGTWRGGIFRSTDVGTTWTSAGGSGIIQSFAVAGTRLYAGGERGEIFRSTDRGSSWTSFTIGLTEMDVHSLIYSEPYLIAAGWGGWAGGVYVGVDVESGLTGWINANAGLPDVFVISLGVCGPNVFVGTRNDGVWRRPLSEMITSVHPLPGELAQEFSLEQNYPNPFNPSTNIRYGLPKRSHVTLTVLNMLGQHVTTLSQGEQEAGYHEVKFEGDGLASGIYLYQMRAGPYTETKKLLLLR